MITALGFALLIGLILKAFFFTILYFGLDLHSLCLASVPDSLYQEYYSALTCGSRLQPSQASERIKQLGIIHLFVVSGAHLHFLIHWIEKLRYTGFRFPNSLATFVYCLTCSCNPPVLRAWVQLNFSSINQKKKLWYSHHSILLFSVITCLVFNPNEIHKVSLPLSWLASLGLLLSKNLINQSLFIYFLSFPIIQSFNSISVWTSLLSLVATPLIALILFPMSFLSFVIPELTSFTDYLWITFEYLSQLLINLIPSSKRTFPQLTPLAIWLYALSVHFLCVLIDKRKSR